jgi:hypothetical protein
VNRRSPKITIVVKDNIPVLRNIHEAAREIRITIKNIDSQIITYQGQKVLRITLTFSTMNHAAELLIVEEIRSRISPLELTTTFDLE